MKNTLWTKHVCRSKDGVWLTQKIGKISPLDFPVKLTFAYLANWQNPLYNVYSYFHFCVMAAGVHVWDKSTSVCLFCCCCQYQHLTFYARCKSFFSFMTAFYITVILWSKFLLLQNNILMDLSCLQTLFSSSHYLYFETFQLEKLFMNFLNLHIYFSIVALLIKCK